MNILLDTHIWVWMCDSPEKLSIKAKKAIRSANLCYVSSISAWEIGMLINKNRLILTTSLDNWIHSSIEKAGLTLIDINLDIAIESTRLPEPCHCNPADKFLIATARVENLSLITADKIIRNYSYCRTVW